MDTAAGGEFGLVQSARRVNRPSGLGVRDLPRGTSGFVDGGAKRLGLRKAPNLIDQDISSPEFRIIIVLVLYSSLGV